MSDLVGVPTRTLALSAITIASGPATLSAEDRAVIRELANRAVLHLDGTRSIFQPAWSGR
jgi:hypothetical protein